MSPFEEREEAEIQAAIREPTMRWLTLAGMVWRTAGVLVAVSGAWSWLKAKPQLLSVAGVVVVANVVVIIALTRRPSVIRLLDSPAFLAIDVGVAFGLNLLASWVIEPGTLYGLGQYRDLFSPYLWGTVVIWTGIRGTAIGALFVILAAVPLQVGMARLNGFNLETTPLAFVDRNMWLLTSYVLGVTALALARRAVAATARQGLRAGKEAERAEMLRRMHDTVLQTLEGIVLHASQDDRSVEDRLRDVRNAAACQAAALRTALRGDADPTPTDLVTSLDSLVRDCLAEGLHVELVSSRLDGLSPQQPVREALLGALQEACTNVRKHADVAYVVVRALPVDNGLQITVRDHGRGFDPTEQHGGFGLNHSIRQRLADVGGRAEISSTPGRGTKVTLWVPT